MTPAYVEPKLVAPLYCGCDVDVVLSAGLPPLYVVLPLEAGARRDGRCGSGTNERPEEEEGRADIGPPLLTSFGAFQSAYASSLSECGSVSGSTRVLIRALSARITGSISCSVNP